MLKCNHIDSHYGIIMIVMPSFLLVVEVIYMVSSSPCTHYGVVYACIWTYAKPMCVLIVSITLAIIFNLSTSAITDYSQSAKDIDPYIKSQLYGGHWPLKTGTHFTEWAE